MYGIQRIEYLDNVLVLCGAGVGGGSHVYGNTLYVPPKQFFDAPGWAGITDWADELAPCYDQARRMLGVVRYPYMPTDVDRYMQQVATEMGKGETFNKAPVGVYFGTPGVEADDPYFDRKLRISIARVDGRLYAFDDLCTCTDRPCPPSGGLLAGTTIICQCHGSRFDVATGAVINGPATAALNVYEALEVEGGVRIRV
jgi:nitrite reductase/ring-hydroxylating ferredoxin subunit